MPILDAHSHAFPDAIAAGAIATLASSARWQPTPPHTNGTLAGLLASMDAAGVERAIVCSIATKPTQVSKITEWSAAIASPRIIPFASIHPDTPDVEDLCARIAALGIRGLKFHPYYMNCPVEDPRTYRIARAAAAHNLCLTFHAGHDIAFERSDFAAPASLRRLFDAIPNLRLQCCHLGGWMRWEESLDLLAGLPIYLETSFSLEYCPPDLLHRLLEKHPATHLQWGTDSPWKNHATDLALFNSLPLTPAQKSAALWDNSLRFLGLA